MRKVIKLFMNRWLTGVLLGIACKYAIAVQGGFILESEDWNHSVQLSGADLCSATVLTETLALTAAHCVDSSSEWRTNVLVGAENLEVAGSASLLWFDPRYDQNSLNYDIAIIEIDWTAPHLRRITDGRLQSAGEYFAMMNGVSPMRSVLAIGYGQDGKGRVGTRKAAILEDLTVSVGDQREQLMAQYDLTSTIRPGDSGGGVYALYAGSDLALIAVTSGVQTVYEADGVTPKASINLLAPVAPSLCAAPAELRKLLSFSRDMCSAIEVARAELGVDPFNVTDEVLLWQFKLLNQSPQQYIFDTHKPKYLTYLALDGLLRGMESHALLEYVKQSTRMLQSGAVSDPEDRSRLRPLLKQLRAQYSDRGYLRRSVGVFTEGEVNQVLDVWLDRWLNSASLSGESCPYKNCASGNLLAPILVHSAPSENWDGVISFSSTDTAQSASSMSIIGALICSGARWWYEGDDTEFYDVVVRYGIQSADLSIMSTDKHLNIEFSTPVKGRLQGFLNRFAYDLKMPDLDRQWVSSSVLLLERDAWVDQGTEGSMKAGDLLLKRDRLDERFSVVDFDQGIDWVFAMCKDCDSTGNWRSEAFFQIWSCD